MMNGRIAIKRTIHPFVDDVYPLSFWFTYLIVVIMLVSLAVSVIYLNKAVSAFSVNLVTPILYVEFTALSITGSAILYREWSGLVYTAIISMIVGFFVVIIGAVRVPTRMHSHTSLEEDWIIIRNINTIKTYFVRYQLLIRVAAMFVLLYQRIQFSIMRIKFHMYIMFAYTL